MSDVDATMILPRSSYVIPNIQEDYFITSGEQAVRHNFTYKIKKDPEPKRIAYLIKNDVVHERCEYRKNIAICYLQMTNEKLRSFQTRFQITQVIYARMVDEDKVIDYIVITGHENFVFIDVRSENKFEIQTNNIRIQRVFAADRGILIERARVKGEIANEDEDEKLHVFSLMHPNDEIMPVLYQDLSANFTNYAFNQPGITLLPSPTENRHNVFLAYDTVKERHLLLTLKKASKTEQSDAYRLQSAQTSVGSAASFRITPRRHHTPKSGANNSDNLTPLRRSIRNRARMMASEATPLTLDSRCSSFVSSDRTLAMSMRSQKSVVSSIRDTFCNYNLDGEILEEPTADLTLVCVWQEPSMKDQTASSSVASPSNIATSTPYSGPLLESTPKQGSMASTPRSILLTPITGSNVRREGQTPKRNVSFTSTPLTHVYSQMSPAAEPCSSTDLPHKRPTLPYTPIQRVGFSDAESEQMECDGQQEVNVDLENFNTLPNSLALAAVDELIKRQRKKIYKVFQTHDFSLECPEKKPERKKSPTPSPGGSRPKEAIPFAALARAKVNVLRHYNRNMQWALKRRFKPVNALFALLMYRRDLYKAVLADVRLQASNYLKNHIATRFFVTTDVFGHVFVAFLPGGTNKLKLIRWNSEQRPLAVAATTLDAFDAIPVYGNRMFAVLKPDRETIELFTGIYDIGNVYISGFHRQQNRIMQLVEGTEHTINVKFQKLRSSDTFVQAHNIDPNWSDSVKKVFDTVFATLPAVKAVNFFKKWFEGGHLVFPSKRLRDDPLAIEYPVLMNYFFQSLGLKVNFGVTQFIRDGRLNSESLSEQYFKRSRIDLNSVIQNSEEIDEEIVFNVEYLQQRSDLGDHAFAVFHILHLFYESFSFFAHGKNYEKIFIEPLYVFAKLTGLEKYAEHYISRQPNLKSAKINLPEGNHPLPRLSDAKSFAGCENNVISATAYIVAFEKRLQAPVIPRCLHWPQGVLLCASIVIGKVNSMQMLRSVVGSAWQKRFNLTLTESTKVETTMNSTDNPIDKCRKMMKILRLNLCDLTELLPSLCKHFTDVIDANCYKTMCDDDFARRSLKEFPTKSDLLRMQRLQWPLDIRCVNVHQFLDSSLPILLPLSELSESATRERHDSFLHAAFYKQVAKAFGRAGVNLKTAVVSKLAFSTIPTLEINGIVQTTGAILPFPINATNPNHAVFPRHIDWAEFYNGISHTLRFAQLPDGVNISLTMLQGWLNSSKTNECAAAGAVLGLGLSGLFLNYNFNDVHDMVTLRPDTMLPAATLLAIAASHRASCNMTFFRMVSTFLPFYTEPTNIGLKVIPLSQVSALVSLGLLFEGTCNQSMTSLLVDEMAKETIFKTPETGNVDRYSYFFNCGVAIGLISMGQGVALRNAEVSAVNQSFAIDERLDLLLKGGHRMSITSFGRANKQACPAQAFDIAALNTNTSNAATLTIPTGSMLDCNAIQGLGTLNDLNNHGGPYQEPVRKTANVATGHLEKESSVVRETTNVNHHVTSPGACIALTLRFLRTGDQHVMKMLECPDEVPLLEAIRPDVIMMRMMGMLLVQWDIPIESNSPYTYIPQVIVDILHDAIAGRPITDPNCGVTYDINSVAEAYVYMQTGVALAKGIRYASTCYVGVLNQLFKFMPWDKKESKVSMRRFVRESVLQNCTAMITLSMAMVMAGSGNLDVYRAIRRIRNYTTVERSTSSRPYEFSMHTIANMAAGFLFLGNGRCGFSDTVTGTSMLLISIYPIFVKSPTDNNHYFQPLRFFYCFAVEFRFLVPVDNRTHKEVRMVADLVLHNESRRKLELPAVLPPLTIIKTIKVHSKDYEEIFIDLLKPSARTNLEKIFKEFYGRLPVKKINKKYVTIFDKPIKFSANDTQDLIHPPLGVPPPYERTVTGNANMPR